MDYCARESTICDAPVIENRRGGTIACTLQEANKILNDMAETLRDIEHAVTGNCEPDDGTRKSPQCLQEEAAYTTALSYECLCRAKRIREGLI